MVGGWCAFASKDDSQSESRKYKMLIRWLMEPWRPKYVVGLFRMDGQKHTPFGIPR